MFEQTKYLLTLLALTAVVAPLPAMEKVKTIAEVAESISSLKVQTPPQTQLSQPVRDKTPELNPNTEIKKASESSENDVKEGEKRLDEVINRLFNRYDADSIGMALRNYESWPVKSKDTQEEYELYVPMVESYNAYNQELMAFIEALEQPMKTGHYDSRYNGTYLVSTLDQVMKSGTSKNGKLRLSYGKLYLNRQDVPSIPYLNKRIKRLREALGKFDGKKPEVTLAALDQIVAELRPAPKNLNSRPVLPNLNVNVPTDDPRGYGATDEEAQIRPNPIIHTQSVEEKKEELLQSADAPSAETGEADGEQSMLRKIEQYRENANKYFDKAAKSDATDNVKEANELRSKGREQLELAKKEQKKLDKYRHDKEVELKKARAAVEQKEREAQEAREKMNSLQP